MYVFLAVLGLHCFVRAFSGCCEWRPCGVCSTDSRCTGFRSCSTWAQELWRLGLVAPHHVGLHRPGIQPTSPSLAGGFLFTESPGKSCFQCWIGKGKGNFQGVFCWPQGFASDSLGSPLCFFKFGNSKFSCLLSGSSSVSTFKQMGIVEW